MNPVLRLGGKRSRVRRERGDGDGAFGDWGMLESVGDG